MICLSKESMEKAFQKYLECLFKLQEIKSARVRDITIDRANMGYAAARAFEAGYHDCFSDVDLSVRVCLPADGSLLPEAYMKRIDRFGVHENTALGWLFVPENRMYRLVFKNGMRYDLGFEFEYGGNAVPVFEEQRDDQEQNGHWRKENIHRFWFVQVQALGKLYRRDYLISSHLANLNCNETLVMQMVLRNLKYGTNHHRYGYSEALEYVKDLGKMPYQTDDPTFCRIADHLYAAALSYDRLAKVFYPQYQPRSGDFFAIWNGYEASYKKV